MIYNNKNAEEVEAGSILVSLANQNRVNNNYTSRSMSISNLLEDCDIESKNYHYSTKSSQDHVDYHRNIKPSSENHSTYLTPFQKLDNNKTSIVVSKPPLRSDYTATKTAFIKQSHYKQHPKIRRNALQAYISYMTYTDLTQRQKKTMLQNIHQQMSHHPTSSHNRLMSPEESTNTTKFSETLIVEQPLTAFLHHQPLSSLYQAK
ncbi:uncharacterized protein BX663DRAFT_497225 [Cokeromyces recurvatus]|uniref:uncharacterized protein n=1 Tax=Cokeromyces recurvatus TaxID=90255 RepID=UPI0022200AEE|nr:uncharacterized protein BX663DRAFT_497225 [Cokeromyces recurvatus]KAI7906657.1 hypothetical protein BX663DRAFT_497225 [Cokeromyces recurvatus]